MGIHLKGKIMALEYLARGALVHSFHNYKIVFEVQISFLFKLDKLMVAIGKKPAPGDHESG